MNMWVKFLYKLTESNIPAVLETSQEQTISFDSGTAALIAAVVALLIGMLNIVFTSRRIKMDGITKQRMLWIEEVRNLATIIIAYPVTERKSEGYRIKDPKYLGEPLYKLMLYLNVQDEKDQEIIDLAQTMVSNATCIKFLSNSIGSTEQYTQRWFSEASKDYTIEFKQAREKFIEKIRVYLKVEWTRVKVESSVFHCFSPYWRIFKGFNENKAHLEITKNYRRISIPEFAFKAGTEEPTEKIE